MSASDDLALPEVRPWQVISSTTLFSRHWLELREDRVRLANGHEIEQFHVLVGPSWAGVVCVTEDDRVVLVRQYRHGLRGASLELPAGVIEGAEDPMLAAQRELLEETGYGADRWVPLLSVAAEPARHAHRAHFFCAQGARHVAAPRRDASEEMHVVLVQRSRLIELVERGQIVHGVHIGAILLAARRGLL